MLTLSEGSVYILVIYAILFLPVLIVRMIASWHIFEKTGEKGWKALIPFYSAYILCKRVWDKNAYWFLLIFNVLFWASFFMARDPHNRPQQLIWLIVCAVTYIISEAFYVFLQIHLAKAFAHNGKFALGLIFVHVVFVCILGFGRAQYIGIQPLRAKSQLL